MHLAVYALGAITIFYVVFRPSFKKKKKDPLADPLPKFSLAQQRSVERQMQNLLVELSEMSRQITSQLDTRAARLEALIEEADQKIAQLGRAASKPIETPAADPRPADDEEHRYAEVYDLSDQGQSSTQIAAALGLNRGEVELILALRVRV